MRFAGTARSQEILKAHKVNAELITKAGRPVREIVKRTQEPNTISW